MGRQVRPTDTRLLRSYGPGHRNALVCFPHAGAGTSAYHGWARQLAAHADVVLVQLKGREDRTAEPLTDRLGDLALEIAQGLCELPYDDLVLLGHSMGAALAWAVADAIWAVYRRRVRVVLSAQAPPPYTSRIGEWPLREVRRAGATDAGRGLGQAVTSAADAFHSDVRAADLAWMSRELPSLAPRPLPVDLYCVSADQDHLVTPQAMAGWASLTTRHFSQLTVSGGHMYLLADPAPLLGLARELAAQDSTDRVATVVQ